MSNDNRDRKLKHHEKPIWRKAFEASMQHTSIEGATRNAWKAVDAWNQANAFNESIERKDESDVAESTTDSAVSWNALVEWIEKIDPSGEMALLREMILDRDEVKISLGKFMEELAHLDFA